MDGRHRYEQTSLVRGDNVGQRQTTSDRVRQGNLFRRASLKTNWSWRKSILKTFSLNTFDSFLVHRRVPGPASSTMHGFSKRTDGWASEKSQADDFEKDWKHGGKYWIWSRKEMIVLEPGD